MEDLQPTARDYFVSSVMELIRIDTANPMNLGTVEKLTNCIPQNEFLNFIAFLSKKNNDYKKPIEVVGQGVKEFEYLRAEQLKNSGLESDVKKLVDRCRAVVMCLYDRAPKGFTLALFAQKATWDNFGKTFTDEQMKELDGVGGCKRWILEHDENSFFVDLVENKIKSTIMYSKAPVLEYQSSSTMQKLVHRQSA
ncbi:hypothetical protein [Poseidonibacter lekithochrous]|uniref:hypothetical protein n=1 Tax=Poseidonibacter lekithochrous TaxID=1904463 RepID=UPI000D3397BC|nr:hypothetical protein [Poseidonibacter lekithochrous]